jgi:hypothetical protein
VHRSSQKLVDAYQEDLLQLDELRPRLRDLRTRLKALEAEQHSLEAQQVDEEALLQIEVYPVNWTGNGVGQASLFVVVGR